MLLTSDAPRHRALARRIASLCGVELAAIVVQHKASHLRPQWIARTARRRPRRLLSKLALRLFHAASLRELAQEERARFGGRRGWPEGVRIKNIRDINGEEARAAIATAAADVIAVSGTTMIRAPVFELRPSGGFLNLHTGISPYYKGGPNCTLWCLGRAEPQFIGATIHELDPGVDSGRLILTAQTPIEEADTATALVCKTIELGAELYARVLAAIARGEAVRTLDQSEIGEGHTFLTRDWTAADHGRAYAFVRSGQLAQWVRKGRPGVEDVRLFEGV